MDLASPKNFELSCASYRSKACICDPEAPLHFKDLQSKINKFKFRIFKFERND